MIVYLRYGSAQTIVRAAALKYKLQIPLSISPSHSILTPRQPIALPTRQTCRYILHTAIKQVGPRSQVSRTKTPSPQYSPSPQCPPPPPLPPNPQRCTVLQQAAARDRGPQAGGGEGRGGDTPPTMPTTPLLPGVALYCSKPGTQGEGEREEGVTPLPPCPQPLSSPAWHCTAASRSKRGTQREGVREEGVPRPPVPPSSIAPLH